MSSIATCFRFVAPVEAVLLIIWWAIDLISNETESGQKWYEFGRENVHGHHCTGLSVLYKSLSVSMRLCVCLFLSLSLSVCLSLFLSVSL